MPPLSPTYLQLVAQFDAEIKSCIDVSRRHAKRRVSSQSHFLATALFTAICTRAVTLRKLLPRRIGPTTMDQQWDYASFLVLTRSILELRLTYYYIAIDDCSPEEWECRWRLLCLHDCCAKIKMYAEISPQVPSLVAQLSELQEQLPELKRWVEENPHFQQLPLGKQKRFCDGKERLLYSLEEVAVRTGAEVSTFRYLWQLLSGPTHALPYSFLRMDRGDRGRGVHSEVEERYISLCLPLLVAQLHACASELAAKFASAA